MLLFIIMEFLNIVIKYVIILNIIMLLLLSCIRRLLKPVPRIESSTGDAQLAAHTDDCQMQIWKNYLEISSAL